MPILDSLKQQKNGGKILVLGSGGLSIGQAGEFDYSGSQAIRALREEGFHVVLVNPNIATVQTNPEPGVSVYLYPVTAKWVTRVIEKERPVGIVAGFGGQTALNCLIALDEQGVLEKYQVENLGTPAAVLKMTEDRDEFSIKMKSIDIPVPPSIACSDTEAALQAASKIGYPVIVRAAFALGGLGSGFASSDQELIALVKPALSTSPQVLVEKSLKGWKEVEYEVMRDRENNVITICNMENYDPLGIHTGDSIVVCPSQSLSDEEYQRLRNASIKIVESCGVVGECNVQFALSPDSLDFYVIEINARLSRSSALASKASGYPIAYIAGKVVCGYDLLELKNPVTGVTYSYFEPALDYVTVKMPRWDLVKFPGVSRHLGSTMKSVGEVMSIGRSLPEALQKAVRMVTERSEGLSGATWQPEREGLAEKLAQPTDQRLFHVHEALRAGMSPAEIHDITKIDPWFLFQNQVIYDAECDIIQAAEKAKGAKDFIYETFKGFNKATWRRLKNAGFGDAQIAYVALVTRDPQDLSQWEEAETTVRKLRLEFGVRAVVKKIDTTAAEYPSPSNYLYMTYGGDFDDPLPEDKREHSALVLGGGSYRIGTSVEFDWCAVSCSKRLQEEGWKSVIINCNPETVSTDYGSSDRLYFEELSVERILDIMEFESCHGAIVCMGGQLPNKLAGPLHRAGVRLLGHSFETIDRAEDRNQFSALLDRLNIDQPRWIAASDRSELDAFIDDVGFPVLIRPSYVLSGAAMGVAFNRDSLEDFLSRASQLSKDHPVVVSEFVEGAREIELDGVAYKGEIVTSVVSEHIENAGVHSGDATTVVPAQNLRVETVRRVRKAARAITEGLNLNGPFNIQFLAKDNAIKVIECNARAARSFPFVSKVVGVNLANAATEITMGRRPEIKRWTEDELPYVGIKAAMFSFTRLAGADPVSGVEMASTGEVGCIGHDYDEAILLGLEASLISPPSKGVLVSSGGEKQKLRFLKVAKILQKKNIRIYATEGSADHLAAHGFEVTPVGWPGQEKPNSTSVIENGLVDFVINIPKNLEPEELQLGTQIRQEAVRFGVPLLTNMEKTLAYIRALEHYPNLVESAELLTLQPFQS